MNRQRYEPIPQRPRDETIILDNIYNHSNYNYNSGIPNSVASSTHTPSMIAASLPSSPPPSFHTHSSPGTPRPAPSHASTRASNASGPSYAELWGVAPSTTGETDAAIGTSNDALATITSLKMRVEWLEESIGRLLLERENQSKALSSDDASRSNCCVSFTDATPSEIERALRSRSNCCVAFSSQKTQSSREKRLKMLAFCSVLALVCLMLTIIMTSGKQTSGERVLDD